MATKPAQNSGVTVAKAPPAGRPFRAGTSGNPGGRPKEFPEFRKRAREAVDEHVLDGWIEAVKTKGDGWLKASELLVAYAYGKPTQTVEMVDPLRPARNPSEVNYDFSLDFSLLSSPEILEVGELAMERKLGTDHEDVDRRLQAILVKAVPREVVESMGSTLKVALKTVISQLQEPDE